MVIGCVVSRMRRRLALHQERGAVGAGQATTAMARTGRAQDNEKGTGIEVLGSRRRGQALHHEGRAHGARVQRVTWGGSGHVHTGRLHSAMSSRDQDVVRGTGSSAHRRGRWHRRGLLQGRSRSSNGSSVSLDIVKDFTLGSLLSSLNLFALSFALGFAFGILGLGGKDLVVNVITRGVITSRIRAVWRKGDSGLATGAEAARANTFGGGRRAGGA
jgi:hypothetical protein